MEAHGLVAAEIDGGAASKEGRGAVVARRTLDVVGASIALIALAPILLVAAIAIKLESRGPVLFRQRRLGRDMSPFTVNKLRTMKTGAAETPHQEYVHQLITGSRTDGGSGGLYKLAVDDRITRVGRFLRKTSIDEVPQFVNVLKGEMSLVGPRPVIEYEAEIYPAWYRQRFDVKPGITGLWQVSGRNERSYEEMVQLDIQYAVTRTLSSDIRILAKTVWVVISRKGVT